MQITRRRIFVSVVLIALFSVSCTVIEAAVYRVSEVWKIGGDGGWGTPALDSSAHLLYIPRTDRITVVDALTGKVSNEIRCCKNAQAVALDATGKYGYVSDQSAGREGFLRVFDRITNEIVQSIAVGAQPDSLIYVAESQRVYVLDLREAKATVVDAHTLQVAGTISLDGRATSAVSDAEGSVYFALPEVAEIVRVNSSSLRPNSAWHPSACAAVSSLAIDRSSGHLIAACENNSIAFLSLINGHTDAAVALSARPLAVDFDPVRRRVLALDSNGALQGFSWSVPSRVGARRVSPIQTGVRTFLNDPSTGRLYFANAQFGQRTGMVSEELRFRPTPVSGSFVILVGEESATTKQSSARTASR